MNEINIALLVGMIAGIGLHVGYLEIKKIFSHNKNKVCPKCLNKDVYLYEGKLMCDRCQTWFWLGEV